MTNQPQPEEKKEEQVQPASPAEPQEEQQGGHQGEELSPEEIDQLFGEEPQQEEGQELPRRTPANAPAEVTLRKQRTWGGDEEFMQLMDKVYSNPDLREEVEALVEEYS